MHRSGAGKGARGHDQRAAVDAGEEHRGVGGEQLQCRDNLGVQQRCGHFQ